MLDKAETLKQARRNSVGHCEHFDKDYNTDSRVPSYNPLKIQHGPYSHHQQLLHYLQQTHYQLLQGHRYHFPHHRFHSHCCYEQSGQQTSLPFVVKAELRSTEKRGFLSPSHKECKEESEDGEKREGHGDYVEEERRMLQERLGLHPNANITSLKRPHGDCKQQTYYHHSNHQEQQYNTEKKMDNEEDVDIKVDNIDVVFGEAEDKDMMKCKFNNCNDSSSSINGRRSCSISISSNSSSTSGSVCSGDEDDADSGIDGGHHKDNNNNRDSNNISLETTELRIIDITPTQTYTDTGTLKDIDCSSTYKNTRVKNHDTDYQQQITKNNNANKMRETSIGECAYYQNRRTPGSPQDQVKNLSAIFTHEDAHNPPDLTRKFTNFFIDDILKPEFGKKPFETGTTTIPTLTPVVRRRLKPFPSSSFPFSISSLSQSPLLSSSSPSSIASQNSGVPSSGKKKSFSRYGSDPRRCSPSKSSASPLTSVDSSRTESDKQQTLSPTSLGTAKKDLTTGTPVDPKSSENLPSSTGFQFKYPAWVFCTRYSDRPSSGPRSRKMKRKDKKPDEKRPRTAFTPEQLQRLKREFDLGRYLTEERRQSLAKELGLNESQIKIWFQNKRAKMKKVAGTKNPLALQLIAEGLYNHQTNKDNQP